MAALRGWVKTTKGNPGTSREVYRLGESRVESGVQTRRTIVSVTFDADGSFAVAGTRDGKPILTVTGTAEGPDNTCMVEFGTLRSSTIPLEVAVRIMADNIQQLVDGGILLTGPGVRSALEKGCRDQLLRTALE